MRASRTYQDAGFDGFFHSLSLDPTIMMSQNSPIIGERVIIFVTKYVAIAAV